KEYDDDITVHVVEPSGSPVLSGGKLGPHKLVGTSPGFIPSILNMDIIDEIFIIKDEEAYDTVREHVAKEGMFVMPSAGDSVYAAIFVTKRLSAVEYVVSIAPDYGESYLSTDLSTTDEDK